MLSMLRHLIQISLPVFQLRSSPTDFYEASKIPEINLKETDYKNNSCYNIYSL